MKQAKQNIPVVILAGGNGVRMGSITKDLPKPMVKIGGVPLLIHIMRSYAAYGCNEFIILCGYKAKCIQKYFRAKSHTKQQLSKKRKNYEVLTLQDGKNEWNIYLLDTGTKTLTGGRIKRAKALIGQRTFFLTYGDGISDIDFSKLYRFHRKHGKQATLTAVYPPGRFGELILSDDRKQVLHFREKPRGMTLINGGFFVLEPEVFRYIKNDKTVWEKEPLEKLSKKGNLASFVHGSFWQCMDTMKDKQELEQLCSKGQAPWKVKTLKRNNV